MSIQPVLHRFLKPQHLVLAALMNFLWGANLLTAKWGLRELPPILFAGLRVAIMLLLCLRWRLWVIGLGLGSF